MKMVYKRSNGTLLPYGEVIVKLRKYKRDWAYEEDVFLFVCQVVAYTHTDPDVTDIPLQESNLILDDADLTRVFWQDHAHRFPQQTVTLNVPIQNILRQDHTWAYNTEREPLQSIIYALIPDTDTEPAYNQAEMEVCTNMVGWRSITNFMDAYDERRAILRQMR